MPVKARSYQAQTGRSQPHCLLGTSSSVSVCYTEHQPSPGLAALTDGPQRRDQHLRVTCVQRRFPGLGSGLQSWQLQAEQGRRNIKDFLPWQQWRSESLVRETQRRKRPFKKSICHFPWAQGTDLHQRKADPVTSQPQGSRSERGAPCQGAASQARPLCKTNFIPLALHLLSYKRQKQSCKDQNYEYILKRLIPNVM